MIDRCLFDDLAKPTYAAPCAKCRARREPFGARFYEAEGPATWWAAEMKDGPAIFFRVFPPNPHGLATAPEARFAAIRTDYRNERETIPGRYRLRPARGRLWATARLNAEFRRFLAVGEVERFRPARACEVMCWLVGHQADLLSAEDQESLLTELETYLP